MTIFNSYVKLPEGIYHDIRNCSCFMSCFIVVSFGLSPSSVVGLLFVSASTLGVQAVCNQLKNIWKNEEGAKAADSAIGHFLCFC